MPKGKKVKAKATKVQELAEETLSNTESASSAESGSRTVLKRNDFICGTGHNQHLQEDFVEDKGLLVGRKLHHQRHRPTNQESSQSSPSSPDSRSLRSTPGVDQQLDTVSEEPKDPKDQSEILKKCHSEGQHTLKSKWGFRSFQGLFSKSVEDSRESPDPETNNPGTTTKPEFVLGDCGTQAGTRTPVSNGNLPKWSHARSYSYVGTEETESRPRRGPLNRQDSFSRPLRLQETRSLSESESEGKVNGKVFSRQSLTHTRQAVSADAVQDFMYVKRESVIHPPP